MSTPTRLPAPTPAPGCIRSSRARRPARPDHAVASGVSRSHHMADSANDRGVQPALMRFRLFAALAIALGITAGLTTGTATALATSSGGVSAGPLHWDPSNP